MSQSELEITATKVIDALRHLCVPFHVTGGLASSFYGEPRLTQDIDVVVRLDMDMGRKLIFDLRSDFLVEETAVVDAIQRRSLFQVLDKATFIKVDFHVGERIDGELSRSVIQPLFENCDVPLVSKEDAIVSKLLWIKEGSEKSMHDVIGMLLDPGRLDIQRVRIMASSLGCGDILKKLENEIQQDDSPAP